MVNGREPDQALPILRRGNYQVKRVQDNLVIKLS
jgi:hypothetical protein